MTLAEYFPVFDKLPLRDQQLLLDSAVIRRVPAGTLVHNGEDNCMGLLVIRSGQLRAFLPSAEGREITLSRRFERDICLFSASCVMNAVQFDIAIAAEKETEFWIIPPHIYKALMERSAAVANYTNQIMATRFTDVMWLIEQVLWKRFDGRLAGFLLEESAIEETDVLKLTHEAIASHLGTAREVVTRMLKYFQTEGMVALSRGTIALLDKEKLRELAES